MAHGRVTGDKDEYDEILSHAHTVVEHAAEHGLPSNAPLDEIVREGVRRMLAAALKTEASSQMTELADQRKEKGHRLVVRIGCHQPRRVTTAAGVVEVKAPRVTKRVDEATGERNRFSSVILPPWRRKSPKISEVLPLLYLHGLSSGDFVPAPEQFLGSSPALPGDGHPADGAVAGRPRRLHGV